MFWKNFVYLCEERKVSPNAVCDELGLSNATATKWKQGAMPRNTTLKRIADYFGVPVERLFVGDNEKDDANNADLSKYGIFPVKLKKFRVLGEIACGKPIYADEDRETVVLADADIQADFCLYARGDSMTGARIMDGDIVFIKSQDMVDNGEIAAVIIGDEATLKRVYYYPDKNKLVLNAENPKYEPLVYSNEELNDIRILGKAVAFQSVVR